MKITSAPLTLGTDPSVRRCEHGIAVGFVLNIDRAPMQRPFCDRDGCARAARKHANGCNVAEAVMFGGQAPPPALLGRVAAQAGSTSVATLAVLLLALVPVSLVAVFVASLAGAVAGVAA